ncbi:MAG: HAD family phosphatase [Bryobacteraceae bacterium]|nr:HAD family phosphatase [Bryobacteraceae bacterium]
MDRLAQRRLRRRVTLNSVIRGIIFDLGGVLVPLDFSRGYRAIAGRCAYPAAEIPRRIGATDLVRRFETGQMESREFVEQLCQVIGLNAGYDEFCEMWSEIFLPGTLIPDTLVEALSRKYRLVLLSNTNQLHYSFVEQQYPILRHFHRQVLSYRAGAAKPSSRIYHQAVEAAGCLPEECFFTDDMALFVEGARRAGIQAELFEGPDKLMRDLVAAGVRW